MFGSEVSLLGAAHHTPCDASREVMSTVQTIPVTQKLPRLINAKIFEARVKENSRRTGGSLLPFAGMWESTGIKPLGTRSWNVAVLEWFAARFRGDLAEEPNWRLGRQEVH
jgi:hypothetical protein